MKKIILLGYMGCGKSSIADILSEKLYFKNIDLDELIENREQKKISEIFLSKGEIYFRRLESEIFRDVIERENFFVLALGGGTPCYANNHELLQKKDVSSIYLKTSVDTLINRLKNEKEKRPIIRNLDQKQLKEYINKHLFERNFYYYQAKHTVTTDKKATTQIAGEIVEIIKNKGSN